MPKRFTLLCKHNVHFGIELAWSSRYLQEAHLSLGKGCNHNFTMFFQPLLILKGWGRGIENMKKHKITMFNFTSKKTNVHRTMQLQIHRH